MLSAQSIFAIVKTGTFRIFDRSTRPLKEVDVYDHFNNKFEVDNVPLNGEGDVQLEFGQCVKDAWWQYEGDPKWYGMQGNVAGCLGNVDYHITDKGLFIGKDPIA